MRRYYTYDDDGEYLAHSKGPWKNHKYIQKIVNGGKTIYRYARNGAARGVQAIGAGAYDAQRRAEAAYGGARNAARSAYRKARYDYGNARAAVRKAGRVARARAAYGVSSAKLRARRAAEGASRRFRNNPNVVQAKMTARAYGTYAKNGVRNAYGAARNAYGNARKWAHDQAGRARTAWNRSGARNVLMTPVNNFKTGYERAKKRYITAKKKGRSRRRFGTGSGTGR